MNFTPKLAKGRDPGELIRGRAAARGIAGAPQHGER